MAYNKRNLLLKIIEIQGVVLENQRKGITQRWVYKHLIKDRYFISEDTFNKYLARNAKRELDELDRKEEARRAQLSLAFL